MEPLRIDGSFGEGGGQIVRTAVTLSCVTGTPVRLEKIRHGRKKPGLRPQHLAVVRILGDLCGAEVAGGGVGSTAMEFRPGKAGGGRLHYDVGTAGSVPLVLAALIPAVSLCGARADLSIRGGTDVAWSPTYEYAKRIMGEAYSRMGIDSAMKVRRRGYYPRGGGEIEARIEPCREPRPAELRGGEGNEAGIFCAFSSIAREAVSSRVEDATARLEAGGFKVSNTLSMENAKDRGGALLAMIKDSDSIVGEDALFDVKKGEFVRDVAGGLLRTKRGVDEHLADMLVVPASVTDGTSIFRTGEVTDHLKTNLYVASKMTGCKYGLAITDDGYEVRIAGVSDSRIH